MKRNVLLLVVVVSFSSCFKIVEAISSVTTKDGSCWIDTRAMILHYEGDKIMDGISIWLRDDQKRIEFRNAPGQKGIQKVQLIELKEVLMKQSVSISIHRTDVHWRDDMSFDISPGDWKRKRVINSTHTHH
jgi:hypothetical protein